MKQKAMIVTANNGLVQLNNHLNEGWRVVSTCGMPSSVCVTERSAQYASLINDPICLVILQKD